jgi:starch synthase (maltosyl-transferring)
LWDLGIAEDEPYVVEELLSGRRMQATGSRFWVRLAPEENPAEIFRLSRAETAEDRADAR